MSIPKLWTVLELYDVVFKCTRCDCTIKREEYYKDTALIQCWNCGYLNLSD